MSPADKRFAEIYSAHFKAVHAYCRRRTSADRVDDATAEVFLAAWRRIDEVPPGAEALPWLYSVAYGVVSNAWRGASRRKKLDRKLRSIGAEFAPLPDDVVVMRQEARQVLTALERLSRSDRELLRLSIWEELDSSSLSVALGISKDAVNQRLSRARRRLAREYDRLTTKQTTSSVAQEGGAW
ncbi:MAG: sigma-70 family RNA polymerase sigma factor [Acidimicrobiia bacterium]|nr:sigma-70 family RNA polymerase sigma factor [Acidimicrobiia bacterium]